MAAICLFNHFFAGFQQFFGYMASQVSVIAISPALQESIGYGRKEYAAAVAKLEL